MNREVFINDNLVIPERIKKMSRQEQDEMIKRLEKEAKAERERIRAYTKQTSLRKYQ